MSERSERVSEALRESAAEFIAREAGPQSLITVTAVRASEDSRRATIYLTVLPESAEEQALAFVNRNRGEFGKFFESRVRGVRIPHVEFEIDRGEKLRQRLDELS